MADDDILLIFQKTKTKKKKNYCFPSAGDNLNKLYKTLCFKGKKKRKLDIVFVVKHYALNHMLASKDNTR